MTPFGRRISAVSQQFPEVSVQNVIGSWWQIASTGAVQRGRLIKTIVPYPGMKPVRLLIEGRGSNPRQHDKATFTLEEFRVGDPRKFSPLPVAGLPEYPGESHLVYRSKTRPAVVVAMPGSPVEEKFRRKAAKWQYARSILVAPFYGCEADGSRGGWDPEFVARIQRAEYSQYAWDMLPVGGSSEGSILRFDHVFPIGDDPANWTLTDFTLRPEALAVVDDWVSWHLTGLIPVGGMLELYRENFPPGPTA
jgi:hypothetical protein